MKKQLIRLTEQDLHRIVKESVKRALKEDLEWDKNGYPTNMPDDDYGNEGFPYMIVTYNGEEEVNREYVTLPKPNLHAYDDEVPFSLGSNQALIELD